MGIEARLLHLRGAARTIHGESFYVTEFAAMRHLVLTAAILLVAVTAQAQSGPALAVLLVGEQWFAGAQGVVDPGEAPIKCSAGTRFSNKETKCSRKVA